MQRIRPWQMVTVVMAFLVVVAGYWGLLQYQDKQEREVEAPQQLLMALQAVSQGEASLSETMIEAERLRADLMERIAIELVSDLAETGHPDPENGAQKLLQSASSYLQTQEGLMAGLEQTLVAVSNGDWQPLIQQPEEWLVQIGEACLLLAYAGSEPEHYWVWVSLTSCARAE